MFCAQMMDDINNAGDDDAADDDDDDDESPVTDSAQSTASTTLGPSATPVAAKKKDSGGIDSTMVAIIGLFGVVCCGGVCFLGIRIGKMGKKRRLMGGGGGEPTVMAMATVVEAHAVTVQLSEADNPYSKKTISM